MIGIQQLRESKEWGPEEIEKTLSLEAAGASGLSRTKVEAHLAIAAPKNSDFG